MPALRILYCSPLGSVTTPAFVRFCARNATPLARFSCGYSPGQPAVGTRLFRIASFQARRVLPNIRVGHQQLATGENVPHALEQRLDLDLDRPTPDVSGHVDPDGVALPGLLSLEDVRLLGVPVDGQKPRRQEPTNISVLSKAIVLNYRGLALEFGFRTVVRTPGSGSSRKVLLV